MMDSRRPARLALAASTAAAAMLAAGIVLGMTLTSHAAPRPATRPASIPGTSHSIQSSWGLSLLNSGKHDTNISAETYWYPQTAGAGAQVYVIDTGVQADLPEFNSRVTAGFDATTGTIDYTSDGSATIDCSGHGTSVASLITSTNVGIAPEATIVPIRALPCEGGSKSGAATIIAALNWIRDHHASTTTGIINMSFGYLVDQDYADDTDLRNTIQDMLDRGFFIAAAAGNDSVDGSVMDSCASMPGQIPGVFTVGAITEPYEETRSGRASFSNAGSCIDAWAPGLSLPALDAHHPGQTVGFLGTSAAAPQVAGLAALLVGEDPSITAAQITDRIKAYAAPDTIDPDGLDATSTYLSNNGEITAQSITGTSVNLVIRTPFDVPHFTATVDEPRLFRTSSTLTITWDAPDLHGQSPVTEYVISIDSQIPGDPETLKHAEVHVPAGTNTYQLEKPDALASYMVSVTPVSSGKPGDASPSSLSTSVCNRWCPRS